MPSKQKGIIWQSFGDLEDEAVGSLQQVQSRKRRTKGPAPLPKPGLVFRDPSDQAAFDAPIDELRAIFADVLHVDVIDEVVHMHRGNTDAAMQSLLELAQDARGDPSASQPSPPPSSSAPSTSRAAAPPAGPAPSPTPTGPAFWDLLPNDVRLLVLDHLSHHDLARTAPTCSDFAARVRLLRERARWVDLPARSTPARVTAMVAAHPNATTVLASRLAPATLHSDHIRRLTAALHAAARHPARRAPLAALTLRSCRALDETAVDSLCGSLPHLTSLDLTDCQAVGDAALLALARYIPDPLPPAFLPAPPAPATTPTPVPAGSAAALPPSASGAEAVALKAEEYPRGLQALTLSRNGTITSDGVRALLTGPATRGSLQSLDVSHCQRLSALHLPPASALVTLRVGHCNSLTRLAVQLPPGAPLRELLLPGCPQLRHVLLVAAHLQQLNLAACPRLVDVSLRCPALGQLQLPQASALTSVTLATPSPHLHHLNLQSARSLEAPALQSLLEATPGLRHLSLHSCSAVSSLPALADGRLPLLEDLVLHGCANLRSLSVTRTPQLRRVDVGACVQLRELRVESGALALVDATNCRELRSLVLLGAPTGADSGRAAPLVRTGGCTLLHGAGGAAGRW